jgi:cation transport ATPase
MKHHAEEMLWVIWFLSLMVAAMTTTKAYLSVIAIVWVVSSAAVIPLHFYKAWRRWREVPNTREYAAWVGFETLAAMALIGLFVYSFSSH